MISDGWNNRPNDDRDAQMGQTRVLSKAPSAYVRHKLASGLLNTLNC